MDAARGHVVGCWRPHVYGWHYPLHEYPDGSSASLQTLQGRLALNGSARIAESIQTASLKVYYYFLQAMQGHVGVLIGRRRP